MSRGQARAGKVEGMMIHRRSSKVHGPRLSIVVALATLLGASRARANVVLAAFDAIPATTNQASLSLTTNGSTKTDTMTLQSGSVFAFSYDTTSGLLTLTRASLLGSDVHFSFGPSLHPCVIKNKIVEDRTDFDYPGETYPDQSGNFVMFVPTKFSGYLGNNCNGDESLYQASVGVVLQGTFAYDAGTGAMTVQNLATQSPFGPVTLTFSGLTFKLTGTVQFNVSSTAPGTIFSDGFESGDVSEWTGALGFAGP